MGRDDFLNEPDASPQETADRVARTYFGVGDEPGSRRRVIIRLLGQAVGFVALIPALFWLNFGEIGGFGWATTLFFVGYCLLAAVGLYFQPRRQYHTPVAVRGDWADRVGAFWLVSCLFGPLLGWVVTAVFPITAASWQLLYGLRLLLAAGLPLLTAAPLTRYLRGKAAWVGLPLLLIITLLAVWSAVNVGYDLWYGPVMQPLPGTDDWVLYLPYSGQTLGLAE
jgi:hypothetical protein